MTDFRPPSHLRNLPKKNIYGLESLAVDESKIIGANNRKAYQALFGNIKYWNKKNTEGKEFKMFIKDEHLIVRREK